MNIYFTFPEHDLAVTVSKESYLKFKPTYLYIKTHTVTGLKYFGKTIKDPLIYRGSGKHWRSHIKKHGYVVSTEIYGFYTSYDDCLKAAIEFSFNNIVKTSSWANLTIEMLQGAFLQGNANGMFKNKQAQEKVRSTSQEKYGVDNISQSPIIKEKVRSTNKERRGVDYYMQSTEFQEKTKTFNQRNYGVDSYSQTEKSKMDVSKRISGSKFYNDGIKTYRVKAGDLPDPSWLLGPMPLSDERLANISKNIVGSKFYNDGIRNHRVKSGESPDPSWVQGKLKKNLTDI